MGQLQPIGMAETTFDTAQNAAEENEIESKQDSSQAFG